MKPLKLAHRDGHTGVCYDTSGSFILTGGSDGKVCIWEGKDDTDTTTVAVGEKVYAVAFQGGRFFAATDENAIRIHTFPDGVGDGLVTRFTSPCRCFCISEDGSLLIAGADDFKVKVISMEENECICLYSEHQAPILSVSFDPTKEFAASASCDGTVKVWGIHDGTTEKSLDLLAKCSEPGQAKSLCQTYWSHDGEFLLIPVENEIHVCLRSSWETIKKIQHPNITETINVMAMSQDGTYLAFGCVNGDMGIYHWQDMKLIDKHSHPKRLSITSMAWNPKNSRELAFCDNSGQLGFLDTVLGTGQQSGSTKADETNAFNDADDGILFSANGHDDEGGADLDEINKFLDDGDDENSIDIGSIKRSLLPEDNDDAASVLSSKVEDQRTVPQVQAAPSLPPVQAPFQPGSTPEHLSNRFMVWNSVGIIRQYAITVSDKWAAIATANRQIRIFTIGGLQRHVFTLPGDVVSLASHRDRLLVAYHRGLSPIPGDQCMGVYLMKIGQGSMFKVLINGDSLPLSRASKLAWLGFSDEGAAFYMDVEGIVRTQDRQCWVPVANTRQLTTGNQTKLGFGKGTKTTATEVKKEIASQNVEDEEKSENQPVKRKASAFSLWFEANKEEIKNAHPEESEEDLAQKAAEDFRALSKEDRQVWVQKAKSENETGIVPEAGKKRKMSSEEKEDQKEIREEAKRIKTDPEPGKKAPLSQSTNAKLARFVKAD
ncbi:WD repeat and HMG-box DNA-binding protein 1-like [Elysia marginata]|uniref:WD repeat and HMG-box DNA-binding protein 1-like n=1 Tax=Elysia marginata TaxID=1093978 RepID=A0AAV4F7W1_9GAST|nr:WD repeat and HMG-box DNA-binding protein 1-like [Elysia marginata]